MRTPSLAMLTLLFALPGLASAAWVQPGGGAAVKALAKSTGEARWVHHGAAVAMADLDGDGDADLLVGAPDRSVPGMDRAGAVRLYLTENGRPADRAQDELWGDAPEARFGFRLANAGDVDGDGADEVLVVSPGEPGPRGAAKVELLELEDGLLVFADWMVQGLERAGASELEIGSAGDLNGDGYADVVIGYPGHRIGAVRYGGACVHLGGPEGLMAARKCVPGPVAESRFGAAVGAAGDVNGDGFDDLFVGAPGVDKAGMVGAAYVFPGGPDGMGAQPAFMAQGEVGFGGAFAAMGDLDHDGADDFAVGSPEEYRGLVTRVGAVFVFVGRPGEEQQAVIWGAIPGGRFGASMTSADFDADGLRELVVAGVPARLDEAGRGRVSVYGFYDGGMAFDRLVRIEGDQAWAHLGHAMAAGDVVGFDGRDELLLGAPGWSGQWEAEGLVELLSIDP